MKRFVCLLAALMMCMALVCPAFAATDTFVPSIGYKDGPEIVDAEQNDEDVLDCLVVTSLKQAEDKTTDIYQEDRDLLLDVYKELSGGTMELPLENESYVIRELVDVSFSKTDCVEGGHGHKQWLAEEGNTITIAFDVGVKNTTDVIVLVYLDGQWISAESVVNNGDGTITCVLEDICPVAFVIDASAEEEPPKTGDEMGGDLLLWAAMMGVSAMAIVVLTVQRRRSYR